MFPLRKSQKIPQGTVSNKKAHLPYSFSILVVMDEYLMTAVQVMQNIYEQNQNGICSPFKYASFGTFYVQIGYYVRNENSM